MKNSTAPEAESGRSSSPTTFNWKGASKASICAFMLACAPIAVAVAQTTSDNTDNSDYVAPASSSNSDEPTATAQPAPAGPAAAASPTPAAAAPAAAAPAAASPAAAATSSAESSNATELSQVAVTGTAIAGTDAATALPVTVITKQQLEAQGITSAAQALQQIPSNNSDAGEGFGSGSYITGGANFADLRGLGPKYTLVLLNGRRLANNAFDGSSVDVNTIPFASIERIEVLRDGASALYGTDAVAGVINFITKKDFQGGSLDLQYDLPTNSGGGDKRTLEATFGHGDLNKDGYNVMISGSYRQAEGVSALDRDFVVTQDASRGVNKTSSFPAPASYFQDASNYVINPAAPGCDAAHLVTGGGGTSCRFKYQDYGDVVTPSNRASVYSRAAFKLNPDNKLVFSYLYVNNDSINKAAPGLSTGPYPTLQPNSPFFPGNGITPLPPQGAGFSSTEPLTLLYRDVAGGGRITKNNNEAHRAMVNLIGHYGKLHYDTAFLFNQNADDISYQNGYYNFAQLQNLLNTTVDPFKSAAQLTPAQRRDVLDTTYAGRVEGTKAHVYTWDGKVTRTLGNWFGGGQAAMAIGAQFRHEEFEDKVNNRYVKLIGNSGGGISTSAPVNAGRDIESVYSELDVPLLKSLEVDGSFRYDNYSDIGDNVDPKVSLRFQPIHQVLLRGSYGEGFRAPSLYELDDPQTETFTSSLNDPRVDCNPKTDPNPPFGTCNFQFHDRQGGNKNLMPETSRSYTAGLVLSPIQRMTFGVTFWWIEINNQISTLAPSTILANESQFQNLVVRDPQSGRITNIITTNQNLGKTRTSGTDFNFAYSYPTNLGDFGINFQGTLTHKYVFTTQPGSPYFNAVGDESSGIVVPKWKQDVQLTWNKENWNAQIVNNYMSGYKDNDPTTNPHVHSYMTWDASVQYKFDNGVGIRVGSQNIFDRDPPFSNQPDYGQGGYDARYTNPLDRTVFGRLTYDF